MTEKEINNKELDLETTREPESIESIQKKFDVMLRFYKFIETLENNPEINHIEDRLKALLEETLKEFPEGIALLKRIDELNEEWNTLNDEYDNGDADKYGENVDINRVLELSNEINELEENPDVMFIKSLKQWIESIIKRCKIIEELKGDKNKILKSTNAGITNKIPEEAVVDIRITHVCIDIILKEDAFKKLYPHTAGCHFVDTPFNLICEDENPLWMEETVKHERSHAYLDGFFEHHSNYSYETEQIIKSFETQYKTYKVLSSTNIFNQQEMLEAWVAKIPIFHNPAGFIDSLHNETVASYRKKLILSDDTAVFVGPSFSTPGKRTDQLIQALKQIAEKIDNEQIKEKISKSVKEVNNNFREMSQRCRILQKFSEKFDKDTEIEILMLLIKPSDYEKIFELLKEKYPDIFPDFYFIELNFNINHLDLNNIRQIMHQGDGIKPEMMFEIASLITEKTDHELFGNYVVDKSINCIKDIKEYLNLFTILCVLVHVDEQTIYKIRYKILTSLFAFKIVYFSDEEADEYIAFCNTLSENEKEKIRRFYEYKLCNEPIFYELEEAYPKRKRINLKFCKTLPFYKIIQELGLGNELEESFKL